MNKKILETLKKIKSFIFPVASCLSCNHPSKELNAFYICKECMENIKDCEIKDGYCYRCLSKKSQSKECSFCKNDGLKNIDKCYSPFRYEEPVRKLIIDLKYNYSDEAAKLLANAMYSCIEGKEFDYIVPVPIHKKRLKQRFKNQSLVLAKILNKLSKTPICEALYKDRNAKTQSKIKNTKKRIKNIENAFKINEKMIAQIKGKSILLLDDIRTSGSTSRACAKALKESGAKDISFICCAIASHNND